MCHRLVVAITPPPARTGRAAQAGNIPRRLPGSGPLSAPVGRGLHTGRPAAPRTPAAVWGGAASPRQSCRGYSDRVRLHRAAHVPSLAFSVSSNLIFSRTFSVLVRKIIPPFCLISAVEGGIQGDSPGDGFCPVGGRNPMLAIPQDREILKVQREMGSPGKQEHLPISYYNFPCAKQNFFIKLFGTKKEPVTYVPYQQDRLCPTGLRLVCVCNRLFPAPNQYKPVHLASTKREHYRALHQKAVSIISLESLSRHHSRIISCPRYFIC